MAIHPAPQVFIEIMATTSLRPDTLEPLPGEAPKPPLRLLEHRAGCVHKVEGTDARRDAQPWLSLLRRWMGLMAH